MEAQNVESSKVAIELLSGHLKKGVVMKKRIYLLLVILASCQAKEDSQEAWGIKEPVIERFDSREFIPFTQMRESTNRQLHAQDLLTFTENQSFTLEYHSECNVYVTAGIRPYTKQIPFVEFLPKEMILTPPAEPTLCTFQFKASKNNSEHNFKLENILVSAAQPGINLTLDWTLDVLPIEKNLSTKSKIKYVQLQLTNKSSTAKYFLIDESKFQIELITAPGLQAATANYLRKSGAHLIVYDAFQKEVLPDANGLYFCDSHCSFQIAVHGNKTSPCVLSSQGTYANIKLLPGAIAEYDLMGRSIGDSKPYEVPEFYIYTPSYNANGVKDKIFKKFQKGKLIKAHQCER